MHAHQAALPGPADAVARYAAAKSRQDVEEALAVCTDDFVLDTVTFGIRGAGKTQVETQLRLFFAAFPDYGATIPGRSSVPGVVTAWGTIHATMRGPFGTLAPTGRAYDLAYVSVYPVRDGLLRAERFFFDPITMCEQLGLPLEAVAAELRAFRAAFDVRLDADDWWRLPGGR
jgi:ketosteroid isomerase-like protein